MQHRRASLGNRRGRCHQVADSLLPLWNTDLGDHALAAVTNPSWKGDMTENGMAKGVRKRGKAKSMTNGGMTESGMANGVDGCDGDPWYYGR